MALKTTVESTTGLFVRQKLSAKVDSPDDMTQLFKKIAQAHDLDRILDTVESDSQLILRKFGAGAWPHPLPKDAPEIARDAQEIMFQLRSLRDSKDKDHTRNVGLHAFFLGGITTRMRLRLMKRM